MIYVDESFNLINAWVGFVSCANTPAASTAHPTERVHRIWIITSSLPSWNKLRSCKRVCHCCDGHLRHCAYASEHAHPSLGQTYRTTTVRGNAVPNGTNVRPRKRITFTIFIGKCTNLQFRPYALQECRGKSDGALLRRMINYLDKVYFKDKAGFGIFF